VIDRGITLLYYTTTETQRNSQVNKPS